MPMPWTHQTLGDFAENGPGWLRTVHVPAFAAFSYDTGYSNARRSNGEYPLFLLWLTGDPPDAPTPEMVTVAERVMADPPELAKAITAALWEDVNGRGPDSGMWWHGALAALARNLKDLGLRAPERPEDLFPALQLSQITVLSTGFDHSRPVADLSFHTAFEREHGLSVLTDGEQVFGTGYMNDACPWKHLRPTTRRLSPF